MDNISITKLPLKRFPLWLAFDKHLGNSLKPSFCEFELFKTIDPSLSLFSCLYRAVSIDRINLIIKNGIDVEPINSAIFADHFDKAWEYGGTPKVMLAIKMDKLQRSYKKVGADTPKEKLELWKKEYPTVVKIQDNQLWLSKLAEDDPRLCSPYEEEYAYWIEGDPFDAIEAVFIFTDSKELNDSLLTLVPTEALYA